MTQAFSHAFVVPAYGDSPFLQACLESIRTQTDGSQLIVATSTPSPYISGLARSQGAEVFVASERKGIAADWNFGLSWATADLVTLAHQDDLYYPDFARQTRALFQATPNAGLCFTDYNEIDEAGRPLPAGRVLKVKRVLQSLAVREREVVDTSAGKRRLLAFGSTIPCPSVTLNRLVLSDFRFSDDYQINLDWDAWWRLHFLKHPFVRSRTVLMGHRIHQDAETTKGKRDGRRRQEDRQMFGRIWPAPVASALAFIYRLGY